MLERALYDFTEAALGRNGDMQWSLSEPVTRRQLRPLFDQCSSGELTADQALDVCIDSIAAKFDNNRKVLGELYTELTHALAPYEWKGEMFRAHLELEEYFIGLNNEVVWATDVDIAREELRPLFVRCSERLVDKGRALDLFCAHLKVKRETVLETLQEIIKRLALELKAHNNVGSQGG